MSSYIYMEHALIYELIYIFFTFFFIVFNSYLMKKKK